MERPGPPAILGDEHLPFAQVLDRALQRRAFEGRELVPPTRIGARLAKGVEDLDVAAEPR